MLQSSKRSVRKRVNLSVASDQMLLELTRDGLSEAFGELWSRHSGAVAAATRSFTNYDPEELTQEAFLKVYTSVQGGGELPASFRAYVASTSRRLAIDRSRRDGGVVSVSYEDRLDDQAFEQIDFSERLIDDTTTSQAFRALPTRQREALWYRDVEDLPVQEIARYLGASPNTTTVLIKRAREAFKTAWIDVQLSPARELPGDCAAIVPKLAGHSRGKLTAADSAKVDTHLLDCTHCAVLVSEANQLHEKLALVLLPLLLLGGASSYTSWVQSRENRTPVPAVANYVNVSVHGSRVSLLPVASAAAVAIVGCGLLFGPTIAELVLSSEVAAERPVDIDESLTGGGSDLLRERVSLWQQGDANRGDAAKGSAEATLAESSAQQAGTNREPALPLPEFPGTGSSSGSAPNADPPSGGSPGASLPSPDPGTPTPTTYPEYRALTASVSDAPFALHIVATPGATVVLVFGSQVLDSSVEVVLNTEGEASYDFPNHRGQTVSVRMTQRYASAEGEITPAVGVALHGIAVPA